MNVIICIFKVRAGIILGLCCALNQVTYSISVTLPHGANADYMNMHLMLMCLHLYVSGSFCNVTKAESMCFTFIMVQISLWSLGF